MHNATYVVTTRYIDIAPEGNTHRAAWFAEFGPLKKESATTTVLASYADWLTVGATVDRDGTIRLPHITKDKISEAVVKLARESAIIPEVLPQEVVVVILHESAKAIQDFIGDGLLRSCLRNGEVEYYGLDTYKHMIRASSLEQTKARLTAEAQARKEMDEAQRAEWTRKNELEKAETEAKKKTGLENTAALLQQIGNSNQVERFEAGLLPDEELYETLFNKMFSDEKVFTGLEGIRSLGFKGQASSLSDYKVYSLKESSAAFWDIAAKFDGKMLELRKRFPALLFAHSIVEIRSNGHSYYGVSFDVEIPGGHEFNDIFIYDQI